MRIGIFTECYKPIINGVVNSIDGFRKGLTELGHEVYIFCPNYKTKISEKNIFYCKSYELPGKSGYHYVYPLDQRKINIAKKLDIIHSQHPFIMGKRALEVAKIYNIPMVFTNHTQYEQYAHYVPFGKSIVKLIIKNWVKSFAGKCDLIIAPAEGIKDKLLEYNVKTEINIVPNGINLEKFNKRNKNYLREIYHLKKWPVFIFVGRIAEEKNITFLIDSFQKVLNKYPECYLVLVGGGPEEDSFRKILEEKKIQDKVIITGFIPYQEVPDYLAGANIFVSASKTEVHPLTVLEAMASGLPSIVFDVRGTGEIVENQKDGIKIKPDNLDNFTSAMNMLLVCKNLQEKYGNNALEKSKKYSYLETSKIMENAYCQLIKIKGAKNA